MVTSIRPDGKPESVIDIRGRSETVMDWRFKDASKGVDAITYETTNAYAAPTNDPALQKKFAEQINQAPWPKVTKWHE